MNKTILLAVDAAQRVQAAADIIVLGARGRRDLPHLPLGSVSHRLLHAARRPVLIVPRPAAQAAPAREEPEARSLAGATGERWT